MGLTDEPAFEAHAAAAFMIVGLVGAIVGVALTIFMFRLVDAL